MKRILLLSALLGGVLLINKPAAAQLRVSVNIGMQPAWGPSGYDYAEYYYLPDVEAYYCVPTRQFVYQDRGSWIYASSLPSRCGNYDLYGGYKVVINERNPWNHFGNHRVQYAPYRYRHDQVVIRDRRGGYDGRGWYRDRDYRNYDRRDNDRFSRRDNDRRDNDRRDNDRFDRHDNGRHNGWDRGRGRW